MSLSHVVSSFRNRLPKAKSTSNSFECEECPICWANMPSNPKVLPCGHQFCRDCIRDLVKYQDDRDNQACCPMCRGPLQKVSAKKLWIEAKDHEMAANDYYRMQQLEVATSVVNRLLMESQREYRLAVEKLEECLAALKAEQRLMATAKPSRFTSTARREAKHRHQQIKVLCKLIDLVPLARYDDSEQRTIQLLRTLLKETKIPMPQMHLKLAKLLHRQLDDSLIPETMAEYQRILHLAEGGRGRVASRQAKKLQGQAHYGLARCHHQLGNFKRACREYRLCERFHALQDYGLAAECHFCLGNYSQAMDYASMQLRKESTRPTVETLLLMAKICKAYFLSITTYRGLDAIEYQANCATYRRCVRHAQILARHELHRKECAKHVKLLHQLLYPSHHKQPTIMPSYIVQSYSEKEDDDDDYYSYEDRQELESEDGDSVEL